MKAVICQNEKLSLAELPEPQLTKGQVLLKVLRCGICGSDLHLRHHCDHMSALARRVGYPYFPQAADAVVYGHEFCGEILDLGPRTQGKLKPGTRVCAVPLLRRDDRIDMIGLSATSPGAYAERIVVQEALMEPIPNGLSDDLAALTEPMAVALHAYRRSDIRKSEVAVVIGCGPVGLALICMLKAHGVRTVIASDYSVGRRVLAAKCGADVVINPAEHSPFASWKEYGHIGGLAQLMEMGVSTREKLGRLPGPWWHVWRMAELAGLGPKRPVIFECMEKDVIEPAMAINKEIELRFVLGYSPLEYRDALHLLADGKVRGEHLITGVVGLDGVAQAFVDLANPEQHAKILIDPSR